MSVYHLTCYENVFFEGADLLICRRGTPFISDTEESINSLFETDASKYCTFERVDLKKSRLKYLFRLNENQLDIWLLD